MAELPTGFKNLDPDITSNRLLSSAKTTAYKAEKTLRQQRKEPKPVLPFIRATATLKTTKQMTSKEINEITEGLNRLYIL
jgi:hypothetical protein